MIRKIVVSFDQRNCVEGMKFYDEENNVVLKSGYFRYQTREIMLEKIDRIIGIESR